MMLDIQDLHKTFGSNQVLKGITTTIDQEKARFYAV